MSAIIYLEKSVDLALSGEKKRPSELAPSDTNQSKPKARGCATIFLVHTRCLSYTGILLSMYLMYSDHGLPFPLRGCGVLLCTVMDVLYLIYSDHIQQTGHQPGMVGNPAGGQV